MKLHSGSIILVIAEKEATIIELHKVIKFVRRIPTTNVADRLSLLEENADLLIAKAEQYVKFRRMQLALAKLKQRTQELDAVIDMNYIIEANIRKESARNQEKLVETKKDINYAVADNKHDEELVLEEKANLLTTLNTTEELSNELELQAMEYDGLKSKFSKCVLSTFSAFCAGLGDGNDFSGEALINRLDAIQRLVAESVYL